MAAFGRMVVTATTPLQAKTIRRNMINCFDSSILSSGDYQMIDIKFSTSVIHDMKHSDRYLLFLLCHFHNELSILKRLIAWSLAGPSDGPIQEHEARTSQALFLVRILIGKLHEAGASAKSLRDECELKEMLKLVDGHALADLDKFIEITDSKDGLVKKLRNKVAFHNDRELIKKSIEKLPNDSDLHSYHCGLAHYFQISDVPIVLAMANCTNLSGLAAIDLIVKECFRAISLLFNFISRCLDEILLLYPYLISEKREVEFTGQKDFNCISVPYFTAGGGTQIEPIPLTIRFPSSIANICPDKS